MQGVERGRRGRREGGEERELKPRASSRDHRASGSEVSFPHCVQNEALMLK